MIIVKPWAEFQADFPDDSIEDEHDIVQFGGKNVAEAIAGFLAGFGCVIEGVRCAGLNGWDCDFSYEGLPLWFQVSQLDGYVLGCTAPVHRSAPKYPLYFQVLLKLNDAMRQDGRFHDLVWRRQEDVQTDQGGSETPVAGDIPSLAEAPEGPRKKLTFLEKVLAPLMRRPEVE